MIFLMTKYGKLLLFIVASQPVFWSDGEYAGVCGHAKCANLAPGTGIESQNETRIFWECQNNNQIIIQSLFLWLTDEI